MSAAEARYAALDGLRAVAITGVLLSHVHVPHLIGAAIGVHVFFVLSGYLITTLLLREHTRSGRVDLRRFAARRVLRLAPALVVVLVVWTGWLLTHPGTAQAPQTLHGVLPSLLYVANWDRFLHGYQALGWLAPMWSLSVEEQFYLLWPALLLLLLRRPGTRIPLVVIGLSCTLALAFRCHDLWNLDHTYRRFGTHEVGDQLLIGCGLAVVLERGSAAARRGVDAASRILMLPAVAFLATTALTLDETPPLAYHRFFYTVGLSLVGLSTCVVLARLVLDDASRAARVLSRRPLPLLGRLSYAIYLWHEFFRMVATNGRHPSRPVLLVEVAMASVVAAGLSHVVVERPFLAWKLRLSPRRDSFVLASDVRTPATST